ncbi:MAG: universal stress protein [Alphaproteobacteria bacterium]|nr:universal stress protein [Alphaproteobacteria bacterium]
MKRFTNILVVFNDAIGAEDALEQAASLARDNGARLTITVVLRGGDASPQHVEEVEKRLQRLCLGVQHAGVSDVRWRVLTGTAFIEIIRQVIRAEHDLVFACAQPDGVLKQVFFGSTATHLVRKCPCPVWIVKPGQPVPYRNILVAIDPQIATSKDQINTLIMDLATSLALHDHSVLHIMHAWNVDGTDLDSMRSEIATQQREAILKHHHDKHLLAVNNLVGRYVMSEIDHRIHLPRGRPEQAIYQLVQQEKIDLILMGSVARVGIPGFFIGNTAETVLGSERCSILTVKPNGFETPVLLSRV